MERSFFFKLLYGVDERKGGGERERTIEGEEEMEITEEEIETQSRKLKKKKAVVGGVG